MSFTYGFYNAINHDRKYDAIQMSQIFDGIINDGVYATVGNALTVSVKTDGGIVVESGRAWFNHTWNYNDTELPLNPPESDIVLDRYDAIVIDIRSDDMYRENSILWIQGTPSSNPTKPTMINEDDHWQHPLAYVYRAAGSTEINQEDITNTVGTSECPFVTGIIDTITTDQLVKQWADQWAQLVKQWADQWAQFVKNYEQSATDWGKNQQDSFEAYVSEFKLQMSEFEQASTDEFNEWFSNIQYVLDGDVAGHLQNEIDRLKEEGLSGSVITVSTPEETLIGKTVTLTGPETSKSGVFDTDGTVKFSGFMDVGNISIQSTDGSQTALLLNTIPYFGNYKYNLAFWNATVNISTSSEDLYGQVITITDSSESVVTTTAFSSAGTAIFNAIRPDTYTFSVTLDGETYSETLVVDEQTTYNITLDSKNFQVVEWIASSGSTKEYTTIAEVLSDERLVRRLMTRHASVDYLANEATVSNEDVIAIVNNDFAVKWIARRKYALDQFNATKSLKTLMDDSGKYIDIDPPITDTPDTIRYYETYGYKDNFSDLNAATRITYLEGLDNESYEPMMTNEGNGTATAGSWGDFLSIVLENKPGMFNKDGELVYWLDENDYTKKEDGTTSDYNNTSFNGGAFAWISRMYMREEYAADGNSREVEFASEDLEGFIPIGFEGPDETLREGVLLPMGYMDSAGRTLVAGTSPVSNQTTAQEKTIIDNWSTGKADGVFLGGAILNFLRDLEYMLYKHTDIQKVGGHGRSNAYNDSSQYNGNIIANAVVANGNVKGFKGTASASKVLNKAFHSQVLFSYQQWLRDPYLLLVGGAMKVSPNYKYDISGGTYEATGLSFTTSSEWLYPAKMQKASKKYGSTFVEENSGSTSTGYCDGGCWNNSDTRVASQFGSCSGDLVDGPARVLLNFNATYTVWSYGVGLMLLPPAGYKPEMAQ